MATKELRAIPQGPVRRALSRLDQVLSEMEDLGGVPGPVGPTGPPGPQGEPGQPGTSGGLYSQLVGGSASQLVAHNLGSRDVQVEMYRATAPYDRIDCDVEHTDVNSVMLHFLDTPAVNAYSVVILGGDPTGGPSGELGYTHVQSTPAAVWSITHPLSFTPNVSVVDSADDQVEGDVSYDSPSLITLTFTAAFSGKAYLS
jgi:hypothetical protein